MRRPRFHGAARQRGISLLIVMIVVLLSSLLALWAFRSSLVNEAIVGNDADYQRAFEAAQAMIQDAEQDIIGNHPDNRACMQNPDDIKICRLGGTVAFPSGSKDEGLTNLMQRLVQATPTLCLQGICAKRTGPQDFWNDDAVRADMTADGVGARYGEYTGALPPDAGTAVANPLLTERRAGLGAWYWVEVMLYSTAESALVTNGPSMVNMKLEYDVVYRITAIANGTKPRTRVVLQSTFARMKPTFDKPASAP